MKKMLFVMNPFAGQRRANRFLPDIISLYNRAGYDVTTYMTGGPGEAVQVVERLAPQMDLIVACGGDGTMNETISGILRSGADVPIGYIPAGSTNDFASSLGLSANIMQAAQEVLEGTPQPYDVGDFGGRYFSYVASFGAFTRSSYATPQTIKNALGHTAYLLEGIQELSQIRKEHIRMEIDDMVVEDDFLFGAISNATSVGGILTLDPKQVDLSDGKFEILLVWAPRNLTEISECIQAVQSQKYNCAMITFRSASQVRVYASEDMPWTLDGEKEMGRSCIDVRNLHHAVRLMKKG